MDRASLPDLVAGMPSVVDMSNLYAEAGAGKLRPVVAGAQRRVYVPDVASNDVYVIDPASLQVIDRFRVGPNPQHVIPSWDLKRLWVASSTPSRRYHGALTPIDPMTGKPGHSVIVPDAYNMYFAPNGSSAIVVAEAYSKLEFRDPDTMKLQAVMHVPTCSGINHADFSADGRYAIFTCEFASGGLVKIDLAKLEVVGTLHFGAKAMPQDVRIAPDGKLFYVADMLADGVHVIYGETFREVGFIPTGVGAHGLYPSRDGTKLYVTNRGTHLLAGPPHGQGSVSVLDFASRNVEVTWPIPGGGSPDMGNVSADGRTLWLSGRFDNVVYAIDTVTGKVTMIPVGKEPHGLTIWPQPGRFSLGHTGNMR
jgi:YVTN family beta-propeller protein